MKSFKLICLLLSILAVLATSCGTDNTPKNNQITHVWRAKVLENGSIVPVYTTYGECGLYHMTDSVWVNLATHRVDDTCTTTMLCVLISRSRLDGTNN